MALHERTSLRAISITSLFLISLYYFGVFGTRRASPNELLPHSVSREKVDFGSLFLTQAQCDAAFPGLTYDIEERVRNGPFLLERKDGYMGQVQGRIKDGKIYIITASQDSSKQKVQYRNAALHALHRALITSPEPIPDTIFSLVVNDFPKNNSWSFARNTPNPPHPNLPYEPPTNFWLMPHFSYWSWPQPFIGAMDEVMSKIARLEKEHVPTWKGKMAKVVWRGTDLYNPIGNKALRGLLSAVTKGKEWADVEKLKWHVSGQAENALDIEEFCKYRYIAYTEGVTYSGRLHYHQACTSIIITPPPTFLTHTMHLLKPIFSTSLPLPRYQQASTTTTTANGENYRQTSTSLNATWPRSYSASTANVVFVAPDWSDLEDTIRWLESHEDVAEGIARRGREEMVGMGYLSEAAEVCYWRALVRGWSGVVKVNETEWEGEDGERWESFVLKGTGEVGWG